MKTENPCRLSDIKGFFSTCTNNVGQSAKWCNTLNITKTMPIIIWNCKRTGTIKIKTWKSARFFYTEMKWEHISDRNLFEKYFSSCYSVIGSREIFLARTTKLSPSNKWDVEKNRPNMWVELIFLKELLSMSCLLYK